MFNRADVYMASQGLLKRGNVIFDLMLNVSGSNDCLSTQTTAPLPI